MKRFGEAMERVPPHAGSISAAALLVLSLGYGVVLGGHGPALIDFVTARSGFQISAVRLTGQVETSDSALLAALSIEPGGSLLAFDVADARDRLATLPWIASATIRKLYPDALSIEVTEKQAFARWADGNNVFLIDRNGVLITDEFDASYDTLPMVAGRGAPALAEAAMAMVAAHEALADRVAALVRVGDRRWDVLLTDGPTIRLPEEGQEAALQEVVRLEAQAKLLQRDVAIIDLRIPDRITIRLTPDAADKRRADLAKLAKRKGTAT
jgi:cell division protein FtsQ